tara:strand:+ start:96 stop:899 length:804 start_codon:yes stop_codon:yes gene_type:complete
MDKEKILKKVANRKTFAPHGGYLAGRYLREYKNQPIYIITNKNGQAIDVVEGEENAEMAIESLKKSSEKDTTFKKAVKEEETKTIENKAVRNKQIEKYKSSTEIQREKYDSAMDEYFKIDGKLQKQIDAIKDDSIEEEDDAAIISNSPQLKNLQKNKIKAMKKVWALSQSGDEDFRDESLDAFGSLPGKDYDKFTPSASPGVKEYAGREQKIDTGMAKEEMMRKNMDVQEGSFSTQPRTREQVSESIPKIPKKKYTDEELLRIIAGK